MVLGYILKDFLKGCFIGCFGPCVHVDHGRQWTQSGGPWLKAELSGSRGDVGLKTVPISTLASSDR